MSKIKPYIAKTMQESPFTIFEADSHMGELSETLHQMLIPDFNEYGITLEHFFVTNIAKPDGETAYERFKDLHIRQLFLQSDYMTHKKHYLRDIPSSTFLE